MLVRIAVMVGRDRLVIMRTTTIAMTVMPATSCEAVQQHRERRQNVDGSDHGGLVNVAGCCERLDFRETTSFSQDGPTNRRLQHRIRTSSRRKAHATRFAVLIGERNMCKPSRLR